jgi:hypothetical protein
MICINCPLFDGFVLLDMAGPITAFETASQCGIPGDSIEVFGSMVKAIFMVLHFGQRLVPYFHAYQTP